MIEQMTSNLEELSSSLLDLTSPSEGSGTPGSRKSSGKKRRELRSVKSKELQLTYLRLLRETKLWKLRMPSMQRRDHALNVKRKSSNLQ